MSKLSCFRPGRVLLAAACMVAVALLGRSVAAHPADEANVYHYLQVEPERGKLKIQHATIVGGLLAPNVWPQLDTDGDRELSPAEQDAHVRPLAEGLTLQVGGKSVTLKLEDYEYPSHTEFFGRSFPAIKLILTAPLPEKLPERGLEIAVRDATWPQFNGVFPHPLIRTAGLGTGPALIAPDGRETRFLLTTKSASPVLPMSGGEGEPTSVKPRGLGGLATDMDTRLGSDPNAGSPESPLDQYDPNRKSLFGEGKVLYAKPDREHEAAANQLKGLLGRSLSPVEIVLGLLAAIALGAAHALTPGHGKAMVGAYLVGSRGTVWDAVLLGIVVTITHTGTVFLLGLVCLWLTTRIDAVVVGHWLGILSGALVLGMGFWLFQRGLLAYHGLAAPPGHSHDGDGHGHAHGGHSHGHSHEHSHSGHTHSGHAHGGHFHGAEHGHSADDGERRPPSDSPLEELSGQEKAGRSLQNRWGVIGLGIAGGMVPCFDALAILLAAVNLGSIVVGMAIIAAFSLGMALVLVAIGVLMVTAKDLMARFTGEAPWVKALPAVSGAFLFLLGAWLTFASLAEAGLVRVGG